jgi:hypothetical protein
MELDLQSLFGLHVHSYTYWLRPRNPPPLPIHIQGRYWSAKIDDISLCPPRMDGGVKKAHWFRNQKGIDMGQWAERCLTKEMVEREEVKEGKEWEQGKGNK